MKHVRAFLPALLMLGLGAALMAAGPRLGGRDAVFMKAVNLCLECVGIG